MPEQRHTAKLSSAHHWEISYAITRAFGESADDSPPIAAILQLLTDRLNWDVGALWVVNELRLVLECIEFYSPEESSFENFATVTRARRFSLGEGLPGTVWATRNVTELPDLTTGNFPDRGSGFRRSIHDRRAKHGHFCQFRGGETVRLQARRVNRR